MMTLAALAATGANARPSGETFAAQEQRIFLGINDALSAGAWGLATGTNWSAVWVGLTESGGNLAYIATTAGAAEIAVVLRGTQFNSLIDLLQDLDVGSIVEFTAGFPAGAPGPSPLLVSQGAMDAFTDVINAV